ncbi:hypothetical protein CC117_27120 [Parafrankia colletiae]|uniref:Luciferase-like domain-containing protein n=1 Tax=Parafrankia colletiae TaxID=573497 RepID=A0A1S1Q7U0_9ACTN|nr:LLM class flavin-dependent oxidoreductase [Parafrankia colletiae]MCK9903094.1 LLM class flavin-dependent oxidoreductase [Frankia sp. Cpl3]OHV30958.1 hypothetical protein CC117_27120 [Parafrankia colletiae]
MTAPTRPEPAPGEEPRPRPQFKLGFMTHVTGSGGSATAYHHLTELFVAADALGVDGGFIAEHHLAGPQAGQVPSPMVALAAIAAQTRQIELGVSAVVLPLTDPVRVAEDAAVLDTLSGGRVQLGLGTGGANLARYPAFGRDPAVAGEEYFAKAAELQTILAGEPVRGTDSVLTPSAKGLLARMWGAHGTEASVRRAARLGLGVMYGTATLDAKAVQRPLVDAYLDEWAARGAVDAPPTVRADLRPRLAAIRMLFAARNRESAKHELAGLLRAQAGRVAEARGVPVSDLTDDDIVAGLNMHIGSPDDIAESLRADPALLDHAGYLMPVVNALPTDSGSTAELDRTIRWIETIATEVAPRLGWRPAAGATAGGPRRGPQERNHGD